MSAVRDVAAAVEALYDPRGAEEWDAVGLVCGDPDAAVRRVLVAVDPVESVVEQAVRGGFDLLLTHHPLYLRGTTSVAATTAKGRLVHRLITSGIALHVAHTNADVARPGVSDALADALGLIDLTPLDARPDVAMDKLVVHVPVASAEAVIDAASGAGAGTQGSYRRCAYVGQGEGTFEPVAGARPTVGMVGERSTTVELRVEMVLPRSARDAVLTAVRAAHPYEQPAIDITETATAPGPRGLGRVGRLAAPESFPDFVRRVAGALPPTPAGIRAAGPPGRVVSTVAVCGGSGDSLLGAARRAAVDVFVTADLRHHPVSEALSERGPSLVDPGHWASEWPWVPVAAGLLADALSANGTTVEVVASEIVTDPWTAHVRAE